MFSTIKYLLKYYGVVDVLIWLLLLSLLCASFPCVCFTLFAFLLL